MTTRIRFGASLLALAAVVLASEAKAYTYLQRVGCPGDTGAAWPADLLPNEWKIHREGYSRLRMIEVITTLRRSIDAWGGQWGNPCCSGYTNHYAGLTDQSPLDSPDENVVGFAEDTWPRYLGSPWSVIAVTLPLLDREACKIRSADMLFNGARFVFRIDGNLAGTWDVDFESIAVHEFGHWIGLDHSQNPGDPSGYESESVMFPSYRGGIDDRNLYLDDKLGACALYPAACGRCRSDADCPDGTTCEGGECKRVSCLRDEHCPAGSVCGEDRLCHRGCRLHAECGPGFQCAAGACVPKVDCTVCRSCRRDSDCGPTGEYLCAQFGEGQGRCTKLCASDAECDGDSVCYPTDSSVLGVCGAPDSEAFCPAGYACKTSFCPALGDPCSSGCGPRSDTCVETAEGSVCSCTCQSNRDCAGGKCLRDPSTGLWSCYPNEGLEPCGATFCPEGTVCVDGDCLASCGGSICDEDEICEAGVCTPICPDCPAGTVCDPVRRSCKLEESCLDVPCGSGKTCVDGKCKTVCGDGFCADGERCEAGRCVKAKKKSNGGCSTAGDGGHLAWIGLLWLAGLSARRLRKTV